MYEILHHSSTSLKSVWKKTPHPSFNIVPSPVKVLEGWCRISDRRPSWHSCFKDPSPILNQGVGRLTASATPVQDFKRQQYPRRCVFSRQPPKLVTQTTLTVLGNRLGWLFASLPTVSTPIPLSIRSAGILILAHLLANMTPIRKVRRLPHGTCQLAAEGRRRCRGLSVELSPHSCVNGPCQISMQIPMSFTSGCAIRSAGTQQTLSSHSAGTQ